MMKKKQIAGPMTVFHCGKVNWQLLFLYKFLSPDLMISDLMQLHRHWASESILATQPTCFASPLNLLRFEMTNVFAKI